MKNVFVIILVVAFAFSKAQIVDTNDIINDMHEFYLSLDHDNISSSHFFNLGFRVHNELIKADLGIPINSNYEKWKYMFSEIESSDLNNSNSNQTILNHTIDNDTTDFVYLPFFFFEGAYLDTEQVGELLMDSELSPIYETVNIFAGAASKEKSIGLLVNYVFNDTVAFSNVAENYSIDVNFGDGEDYHLLSENQVFPIQYSCYGEKSITFRLISNQDTLISYSKINVLYKSNINPTHSAKIYTNKSEPVGYYGNYEYYEGCDNELDKPIIIAEGFDILGLYNASHVYEWWDGTIERLRDRGYDVFTLNFQAPDHKIEVNAEIVKTLIKDIINEDRTGEIFEGIYIGESMGGLIGRVALKELENEGYDHKFNLYVSYDSPQKGAYIPLGLQWLADDLKFFLPGYVSNSYLVDLIEEIFGFDAPIADLYGILNSNAAKQMLFKHYNDLFQSEYTELQDFLEDLGYPEDSRNISFINGSNIASDQGITNLSLVDLAGGLSAPIIVPPYVGHISMQAKFPTQGTSGDETIAGTGIQFEWHFFGNLIDEFFVGVNHPVEKQNITYYNCPGGIQGRDIDGNSIWHNLLGFNLMQEFSFVPTASSIDLQMDLDDDDDLLFFDSEGAHDLSFILEHNLTPFDDIYSLNDNTTHVSYIFDEEHSLELMEIMPDHMFLQNREISNERAFEASNSLVAGNDVTNLSDNIGGQNETHTKNISTGDFILESGSDVKMFAGERIVFRDGFKAVDGCSLLASIETICSNKTQSHSLNIKPPKIIGTSSFCKDKIYSTSCEDCSIQWSLVGENFDLYGTGNEFIIPDNIPV